MSFNLDEKEIPRYFEVQKYAEKCKEDPLFLRRHFWKTDICKYGPYCPNFDMCDNAHFRSEYRPPTCIYSEFCKNEHCLLFHNETEYEKEEFKRTLDFKYDNIGEWIKDINKMKDDLEMLELEAKLRNFKINI